MIKHYHLRSSGLNPHLLHFMWEVLQFQFYVHSQHRGHQLLPSQIHLPSEYFKLQPNIYLHQPNSIIQSGPHSPLKLRHHWKPIKQKNYFERYSTTSASPANSFAKSTIHNSSINTLIVSVIAWEQEVYLCTSKFGTTGHVGANFTQLSLLKLHYTSFWITSMLQTFSKRRRTQNRPGRGWLHTSKLYAGFRSNSTYQYSPTFKAKQSLIFWNQRLVSHLKDQKPHLYHWQS